MWDLSSATRDGNQVPCIGRQILFFNVFLFGCAGSSLLHAGFSLVAVSRGYTVDVVHRLLVAAASFVAEHRL